MLYTPEKIESLRPNEVFVFGSNLRGLHGAGAAKTAYDRFGASPGFGVGMTGQCYALPTKDEWLETLPLKKIEWFVDAFIQHATANPEKIFLVTAIGCGLAGYSPKDIAPMFFQGPRPLPSNVVLPESFWATLD